MDAAVNGLAFYEKLQLSDGHWACSYGGPSFLIPGLVFAMYISEKEIPAEWQIELTRYICHHVNKDGGWGLHTQGTTTVFATVLYYVTLRILGLEAAHEVTTKARERLIALGEMLCELGQRDGSWRKDADCLQAVRWALLNGVGTGYHA